MKFYRCKHCGKIIVMVEESKIPTICCGEQMIELVPGITDGAYEKHVPVYEVKGDEVIVKVGSVEHPMSEEHYIQWICLETKKGWQIKYLTPDSKPEVCFKICKNEDIIAVYEYCNLHSLWKSN